jgi:hypothetical protein
MIKRKLSKLFRRKLLTAKSRHFNNGMSSQDAHILFQPADMKGLKNMRKRLGAD